MALEVELHDITQLGRVERLMEAGELWRARRKTPDLKRELPFPYEHYQDPVHAYRRLGYIARRADENKLSAYTISLRGSDVTTIGIATAQVASPKPLRWEGKRRPGLELSYWHQPIGGRMRTELAFDVGRRVVDGLLKRNIIVRPIDGHELPWMVTLPDDHVKERVLDWHSFAKIEEPARYDIDDGVTEPRQLWVRE